METLTQNILVPTDFSEASHIALRAAALLARQNDARVTLVSVYAPSGVLLGGEPGVAEGNTVGKETEGRIHAALKALREEFFGDVAKAKTALVVADSPSAGIVDYAKKEDADMIVIATHGRSGLKRMLIGSVAEKVVRHAPCPVLTLRSLRPD